MEKWYKNLFITNNLTRAIQERKKGHYVVISYPLMDTKQEKNLDYSLFPYAIYDLDQDEKSQRIYLDRILMRYKNIPWEICQTDRCIVREMTVEDLNDLYEIYAQDNIADYVENLNPDREEEMAYVKDYIRYQYAYHEYGIWIIEEKISGRIIGRAGFEIKEGSENPQLGFLIRREYQRQGYAYEVCKSLLEYARDELQFDTVEAYTHPENKPSQKLLCKLGFQMTFTTKEIQGRIREISETAEMQGSRQEIPETLIIQENVQEIPEMKQFKYTLKKAF